MANSACAEEQPTDHDIPPDRGSYELTIALKRPRQSSASSIESLKPRRVKPLQEQDAYRISHDKVYQGNRIGDSARVHLGDQHFHGPVEQHIHDGPKLDGRVGQERSVELLIEKLKFHQMGSRHATIANAHPSTCHWLLERPEYRMWSRRERLDDHNGILWIKAKPGAGKSTMMKFIHDDLKDQSEADIVISFFFNARGNALERSVEGMYRALLYQVLQKLPSRSELFNKHNVTVDKEAWPIELLKDLLRDAVMSSAPQRLACYVDALDECDNDEMREMVYFFETLAESAVLNKMCLFICFASRHYPHITLQKKIQLVLEEQSGHQEDISAYVGKKLRIGTSQLAGSIRSQVQHRAAGVFLWVVLVVQILNRDHDRGREYLLQERLDEIPGSLSDLFKDLLLRNTTDQEELLVTLQWILCSIRPLTIAELYFAVRFGMNRESIKSLNANVSESSMELFVLDCSKGLAELSVGDDGFDYRVYVQLIHESVKDYLVRETGIRTIAPHLEQNFLGLTHDRLRKYCEEYISFDFANLLGLPPSTLLDQEQCHSDDISGLLLETFPLLGYAVDNLLHHANAASEHDISQKDFVRNFPSTAWLFAHNVLEQTESKRLLHNVDKTFVFAKEQHTYLLREALQQRRHERSNRSDISEPTLLAAVSRGNSSIVELLLDHGASVQAPGAALLAAAAKNYNSNVCRLLLKYCPYLGYDSPLGLELLKEAAHKNDEDVVQILALKCTSTHTARDCYLVDALRQAIVGNSIGAARVLLDAGADPDALVEPRSWSSQAWSFQDHQKICLLAVAAQSGREDLVELLIQRGANVNSDFGSSLEEASKKGHLGIVEILIKNEAYPVGQAVRAALAHGNGDIAELLLEAGADPCEVQNDTTLLHEAIYHECLDPDMVQKLLLAGADPNVASKSLPPLHVAVSQVQLTTVQTLLKAGANVDTLAADPRRLDHNISALHLAVTRRRADIIHELLQRGADVNVLDGSHGSPLQAAAERGDKAVVQLLLDKGANVNATGGYRENATELAFRHGHDEVVEVLLSRGGCIAGHETTHYILHGEADDILLVDPIETLETSDHHQSDHEQAVQFENL